MKIETILFITFGLWILFGCNSNKLDDSNSEYYEINTELKKEIVLYIKRSNLDCHCSVMVDYYNTYNGFAIFNFNNTRNKRLIFSKIVPKTKIGCNTIYFFTGVEKYFITSAKDEKGRPRNAGICNNDDLMIIDSLGNFISYRNDFIFPRCDTPVVRFVTNKQ